MLIRPRASFCRPARTNISSAFLQLPPSCRAFHASPRPQFFEATVTSAHAIFEGLHTVTGLPWAYTIPLAALTIRTVFILPISIYTRRNMQKQVALQPLMESWNHQLKKEAMKEVGHLGPAATQSALIRKVRKKRSEIYGRWGCQLSKNFLPLLQLPIFLVAIEALRMMCGTHEGLFGLVMSSISGTETTLAASALFEPGFATGGALWFPDLTASDPELRLPFMLSATVLWSVLSGRAANPTIWQKRFTRSLGLVALVLGPLTFQVPSAMLVYWISSSLLAHGQGYMLAKLMPITSFKTCKPKRALRIGDSLKNESP